MSSGPILVVCSSSVTRALLVSLIGSFADDVRAVDSLARAPGAVKAPPSVVIVEAAIVRASPDAVERLRLAWPTKPGVVLADRAYSDERRGVEDARTYGALAFVSVPTDVSSLRDAIRRAIGDARVPVHAPPREARPLTESPPPSDDELRARYIERFWSRLDTLDAYQLLRVSHDATQADIVAAFRERALEFHPDRNAELDEETRERVYQIFKRISWAFRRIGETNARKEYDVSKPTRA